VRRFIGKDRSGMEGQVRERKLKSKNEKKNNEKQK